MILINLIKIINNIPLVVNFFIFCFLGPILSLKDKTPWQEVTSSWQFLALCLSLIFTSGLVWYSEKKYTERLLAEQEDEKHKEAQQNNEVVANTSSEELQNAAPSSLDQTVVPATTSLTFTDLMVEVAFWSIVISSACLFIFCSWVLYSFMLKCEKRWNAYVEKNKFKKPWKYFI